MLVLLLFLVCPGAQAETFYVGEEDGAFPSLTAALAAARDGDEIVLSAGVYDGSRETFPIIVDKDVYLHSADGEEAIIASPILLPAIKISAAGARVEGLTVDFLRSGIWVLADDVTVTGCKITLADEAWRESSCGMWVGGAKRMTATDNVFSGCGMALAGPPVTPETEGIPVLTAMFEVGEDREFFNTHTIENNTVNLKPLRYVVGLKDAEYAQEAGQLIAVECENVVFDQLDVPRSSIGAALAYCENVKIKNSNADECGIFGIYIAKSKTCGVYNVQANRCTHGVDIRDVDDCIVADCVADECGQGVFLSWARNCLVARCEIVNNGTGFFSAGGDNNHVDHCRIEDNQLGLYVQYEAFTMTNTTIRNNWGCGLRMTHCKPVVCGNQFENNFVAVLVLSCQPTTCIDNSITGSQNRSFYFKDSAGIKLVNNTWGAEDKALIEYVDSKAPVLWE